MKYYSEVLLNMQTNGLRIEYEEQFFNERGDKEELTILVHPTKTVIAVAESSGEVGLNNNDVHVYLDMPPDNISYFSDLFRIFESNISGYHFRQAYETVIEGFTKRRKQVHTMYHGSVWLRENKIERYISTAPFATDTVIYTLNYMEWKQVQKMKFGAAQRKSVYKLKKLKSYNRLFGG